MFKFQLSQSWEEKVLSNTVFILIWRISHKHNCWFITFNLSFHVCPASVRLALNHSDMPRKLPAGGTLCTAHRGGFNRALIFNSYSSIAKQVLWESPWYFSHLYILCMQMYYCCKSHRHFKILAIKALDKVKNNNNKKQQRYAINPNISKKFK